MADSPSAALSAIGPSDTGATTYTQWVDGVESPISVTDARAVVPQMNYAWSVRTVLNGRQLSYGNTKTPGPRYLRIGLEKPVTVGSILACGSGQVSVLKPGASLPGNMADDSQ